MTSNEIKLDKTPECAEALLKKWYVSEYYDGDPEDISDYFWGELSSALTGHYVKDKWVKRPGVVVDGCKIEFVEEYGGEGQGDSLWVVISILYPDLSFVHYMKTGYHVSHDGSYWDGDFTVVKPKAVVKIEWS